jgi:hypothetical protein
VNLGRHGFPQAVGEFACFTGSMVVEIRLMAEGSMGTGDQKLLTVVELSRLGNIARTRKLSAERRSEIARLAAQARWAKKTTAPDPNDPQGTKRDKQGEGSGIMSTRKPCRRTGIATSQPTLFEIAEPFENLEPLYARAA